MPDGDILKKRKDKQLQIYLIFAVAALFLFYGCGRKRPPVAPGAPDLSPIAGLSYKIDGDIINLSWSKPDDANKSILKGYVVHRSKIGIDEKDCKGCPVLFIRIAELKAVSTEFNDQLEKGNKYIYKIVSVSKYNTMSPDSKFIEFEY